MIWKTYAALLFTGMVILCSIIMLCLGESTVPINMLASILLVSALGTLLQFIAFTDYVIKKMRYRFRLIIYAIPFLAVLAANAALFRWFPPESGAWLMFLLIYLVGFAGISAGFEIYFRVMGKKYDGLLGQYRKQKEERERSFL